MKKISKACLAIIIAVCSFSVTNAQSTIPPALDKIFRLEGNWQGPATLNLGGTIFNFTYYVDFTRNDESSGMYMVETFSHPDLGTLTGYNLIGYNVNDDKIHWFSVDNFGTTHDHLGYWINNDHFFMDVTERQGNKKFVEKIDLIILSPTQVSLQLVATLGNNIVQTVDVTLTKQPNP